MKTTLKAHLVLLALLGIAVSTRAQGTIFTYQGRVTASGTNFSGVGQFKFALVTSTNANHTATATANAPSGGFITGYTVTSGGGGYAIAPAVTVSGGGGSGAAATANLSGGTVTSLSVNHPGNGNYSSTPTVTIAPPPPNISYTTYWSNDGTSVTGSEPAAAVNVSVSNGLFTVVLGDTMLANMTAISASLFAQPNLQLRIWFNNGVNGFAALSPVQNLTPAPYAISSASANSANSLLGTLPVAQLSGTIPVSQLPAGVLTNGANGVNITGAFSGSHSGNGSALTNVSGALPWQVVSGASQQARSNTGYLVANNALTTVTLPASPNVGDVVRVSGGSGEGWKIAQNAGQFVYSANLMGTIGLTWTAHESNRTWYCVASSADGTKLVAGNEGGQLYTSTNSGVTWTPRDSNRSWDSVASSADGIKLVAVASGAQIYTSTNSGVTWTPRESVGNWVAVASSTNGTKLVAASSGGQIYTSTDSGLTWTPRDSNKGWSSVASSADGTKLVAVVLGGQIHTSTDSGVTWTPRDSSRSWRCVASSADGTKLVAGDSGGQIYTSTDSGLTWTPRESTRGWWCVASSADGTRLIAGATGDEQLYTSTDSGVTWTARESERTWTGVASSADGTKLVAVAFYFNVDGQIYTSVPGSVPSTTTGTEGYLMGGPNTAIELQYLGSGQFQPLSHEGSIFAY